MKWQFCLIIRQTFYCFQSITASAGQYNDTRHETKELYQGHYYQRAGLIYGNMGFHSAHTLNNISLMNNTDPGPYATCHSPVRISPGSWTFQSQIHFDFRKIDCRRDAENSPDGRKHEGLLHLSQYKQCKIKHGRSVTEKLWDAGS